MYAFVGGRVFVDGFESGAFLNGGRKSSFVDCGARDGGFVRGEFRLLHRFRVRDGGGSGDLLAEVLLKSLFGGVESGRVLFGGGLRVGDDLGLDGGRRDEVGAVVAGRVVVGGHGCVGRFAKGVEGGVFDGDLLRHRID